MGRRLVLATSYLYADMGAVVGVPLAVFCVGVEPPCQGGEQMSAKLLSEIDFCEKCRWKKYRDRCGQYCPGHIKDAIRAAGPKEGE
jgi:hypothetical protein